MTTYVIASYKSSYLDVSTDLLNEDSLEAYRIWQTL
jgi:hypothetical protein